VLTDPALTLLVVDADAAGLAGFVLARPLPPSAIYDLPRLQIDALYVVPELRRRGLGRALLRAATELAEHIGAPDMIVLPTAGDRTAQRFLARLGFVRLASCRVTDTAALAAHLRQACGS
jgi:GNAT superfamily N-acetyltransferase